MEIGGRAPLILNVGHKEDKWSASRTGRFHDGERIPSTHLPEGQSGHWRKTSRTGTARSLVALLTMPFRLRFRTGTSCNKEANTVGRREFGQDFHP